MTDFAQLSAALSQITVALVNNKAAEIGANAHARRLYHAITTGGQPAAFKYLESLSEQDVMALKRHLER